jgi:hypothetical protein
MGIFSITVQLRRRDCAASSQTRDILVVVFSMVAGLLGALLSYAFVGERLTLVIGLFSLMTPATIGVLAAKRGGILDPVAVFALAYAAYNGLILTRFSFLEPFEFPYPVVVDSKILFRAAIMSSLGTLGIALGWLLPNLRAQYRLPPRSTSECSAAFTTGASFFGVGLLFYLLQYQQLGGYTSALAIDRVERFAMMQENVSTPYVAFVIVGLILMFYGGLGKSKLRTRWAAGALLLWVVAVGLQGDRRLILQILMGVGLVAGALRPALTKFRPLALLAIMLGIFAALLFGQYRPFITFFLSRGMTVGQVVDLARDHVSPSMVMPENTEFGGPYVAILDLSRRHVDYSLGTTYLSSLPAMVPRAMYPGKKTIAPSEVLANSLHNGLGAAMGWGYMPVAEAYLNFGYLGVLPVMCIWSYLFVSLSRARFRGIAGLLVSAALVQQAVNVNRIDFRSVYLESFFTLCIVGAALILISVGQKWKARSSCAGLSSGKLINEAHLTI